MPTASPIGCVSWRVMASQLNENISPRSPATSGRLCWSSVHTFFISEDDVWWPFFLPTVGGSAQLSSVVDMLPVHGNKYPFPTVRWWLDDIERNKWFHALVRHNPFSWSFVVVDRALLLFLLFLLLRLGVAPTPGVTPVCK